MVEAVTFLENLPRWASYYLIAFFLWIGYILITKVLNFFELFEYDFKKYANVDNLAYYPDNLVSEYQELREERNRNTTMNYQIMAILIGAVFVVLSQWSNINSGLKESLIILMVVTLFGVLFIDRRLMFFNNIRAKRMIAIEHRLGIYNLRLVKGKELKFLTVPWTYNFFSKFHVFLLIILLLISLLIHMYIDPELFLSISSDNALR